MSAAEPLLHPRYRRSQELGEAITELYGYITAATHDLLVMIREFDEQELWKVGGVCSTAHWLNWQCGIGMNAAREKVRVARALGELPKISKAFRLGEISYSKVRAMTRVAHSGNEDYLLNIARHGTAHHVETLVRGYRRAVRLNDAGQAQEQHELRSFSYRWDDDGSLVMNGRLPGDVGALLVKALECAMDRQQSEADGQSGDASSAETRPPIGERRANALAEMAESYLANGRSASSSAERYQVVMHVHPDVSAVTSTSEPAYLEHGPHVSADGVPSGRTSRRLCCDASITRLVEDETGEPLSIGRKSRVIPPAMRRALKARDRQCRFPGCTHRYFIDGHHIRHWADGGETSLPNLVLLCRHHHRLVHEGGFGCEMVGQCVVFRDPEGKVLPDTGRTSPLPRPNVIVDLKKRLEDRDIHARTCVTHWEGELMDRHLAVGLLCDLDSRIDQ